MGDLKSSRLMYLKAILFVAIALICAGLLFLQNMSLQTGLLILLLVWASARAYYFMFYVIQTYIDDDFKYSGIIACLTYILGSKKSREKDRGSKKDPN